MVEHDTSGFEELQEEVLANALKLYSEKAIDHAMNPRNVGDLPDADGYGTALGYCGDSIEIWLKVRDNSVTQANFWTDGCASTIASGSAATALVKDKPITWVQRITEKEILIALDGLPEDQEHCAKLAANATREAVKDYLLLKREPWKRAYRRPER